MTALGEWLSYAPTPTQLNADQRWHVFISYRSVNRHWVLELYDILRQLGYSAFLDQYVLSAAAPLALSRDKTFVDKPVATNRIPVWYDKLAAPSVTS